MYEIDRHIDRAQGVLQQIAASIISSVTVAAALEPQHAGSTAEPLREAAFALGDAVEAFDELCTLRRGADGANGRAAELLALIERARKVVAFDDNTVFRIREEAEEELAAERREAAAEKEYEKPE